MTLKYLIDVITHIALLQPNVRTATEGDIYDTLNGNANVKYSVVHITQNNYVETDTTTTFNLSIFYVDRLLSDYSNKLQVQSTGKELISNILKTLDNTFDSETSNITFQPFTERFNDMCVGCYANVAISCVNETDCAEQYGEYIKPTIQVINNQDITITDNGTYYPQNGFSGFGKVEVNVSVDDYYNRGFEQGVAEQKSLIQPITITENGEYVNENGYSPINVNLDLESIYEEGVVNGREEQKSLLESIKITENGVYDNENGFDVVDVEIDTQSYYDNGYNEGYNNGEVNGIEQGKEEQKSLLTSITITENGNYTNENGYNEVIVNVGGEIKPKLPNGVRLENSTFSTIDMSRQDWSNVYDWGYMFYNCYDLTEIQNFPTDVEILASAYMFFNCRTLISIPLINTSNVTDMNNMFSFCYDLTSIPLIDTSKVTNMSYMFQTCMSLVTMPEIDTSNVTNMSNMFYGCQSLTSIPLLNTSNVTNMSNMFQNCVKLTSIPLINTSNCINMNSTFRGCNKLTSIPLIDTSKVTNMSYMFYYCESLTSIPQIDTNNVIYMSNMFYGCQSLTSIPLIDTSNVINMSFMFNGCRNLITIPQLDTSNVTNMSSMFNSCDNLKSIELDITSIEDMSYMFGGCYNLEEIKYKGNPQYLTNITNMSLEIGKNIDNPKMYYPQEFETNYQVIINALPSNWTAIPY